MSLRTVLVLGSTGGFGQFVIHELIRRKLEFARIGVFVDKSRPAGPEKSHVLQKYAEEGIELVEGSPGESGPFTGFDVVLAILGNHAIKNQPELISKALSAGVKHWYPSEFGADLTVGDNWSERYYRDKVLTREYLKKTAVDHPEFGYTFFLNGRLSEWAPSPHFGIELKTQTANIVGTPNMEQSLLATEDAAKFLVCTLLDPVTAQERTYRFVGGNYSWTTIFSTLERIQGAKWNVTYKPVAQARAEQKNAIESGNADAELAASHQVIQGTGGTLLPAPYDNKRFPEVTTQGLEETWRSMLKNKAKFGILEVRH